MPDEQGRRLANDTAEAVKNQQKSPWSCRGVLAREYAAGKQGLLYILACRLGLADPPLEQGGTRYPFRIAFECPWYAGERRQRGAEGCQSSVRTSHRMFGNAHSDGAGRLAPNFPPCPMCASEQMGFKDSRIIRTFHCLKQRTHYENQTRGNLFRHRDLAGPRCGLCRRWRLGPYAPHDLRQGLGNHNQN